MADGGHQPRGNGLPSNLRYRSGGTDRHSQKKHGQYLRANLRYLRRTAPVCWLIATESIKRPDQDGAEGDSHVTGSDSDSTCSTAASVASSVDESDQLMLGELQSIRKELFAQAEEESRMLTTPNAATSNSGDGIPGAVGALEAGDAATAADDIEIKQEVPAGEALQEDDRTHHSAAQTAARASAKRTARRRDSQGRFTATEREPLPGTQEQNEQLATENKGPDEAPGAHQDERLHEDSIPHEEMQRRLAQKIDKLMRLTKHARAQQKSQRRRHKKLVSRLSREHKAGASLAKRLKIAKALTASLHLPKQFESLSPSLRTCLYEYANGRLFAHITCTLGEEFSFIVSGLEGDGLRAWRVLKLRHSERSASSEAYALRMFMECDFASTATRSQPATIATYVARLRELDKLYTQASTKEEPISPALWAVKLHALPRQYSNLTWALEQSDMQRADAGLEPRSIAELISFIESYEVRTARRQQLDAISGGRNRGYSAGRHRSFDSRHKSTPDWDPRRKPRRERRPHPRDRRPRRAYTVMNSAAAFPSQQAFGRGRGKGGRGNGQGRGRRQNTQGRGRGRSSGTFKGICWRCLQPGHRAAECTNPPHPNGTSGPPPRPARAPGSGNTNRNGPRRYGLAATNTAARIPAHQSQSQRKPKNQRHPRASFGFMLTDITNATSTPMDVVPSAGDSDTGPRPALEVVGSAMQPPSPSAGQQAQSHNHSSVLTDFLQFETEQSLRRLQFEDNHSAADDSFTDIEDVTGPMHDGARNLLSLRTCAVAPKREPVVLSYASDTATAAESKTNNTPSTWLSSATRFARSLPRNNAGFVRPGDEDVAPGYYIAPGLVTGPFMVPASLWPPPHAQKPWRGRAFPNMSFYSVSGTFFTGQTLREIAEQLRLNPAELQSWNTNEVTGGLVSLDETIHDGECVWVPNARHRSVCIPCLTAVEATKDSDRGLLFATFARPPSPQGGRHPRAMTLYEYDPDCASDSTDSSWSDQSPTPTSYALMSTGHDTIVIDSGASASYVRHDAPLTNAHPCKRTLRAAGGATLFGERQGQLGCLRKCIAVRGLESNLCSVGCIVHDTPEVAVVFTSKGCFLCPHDTALRRLTTHQRCVAMRSPETHLYTSTTDRITTVMTRVTAAAASVPPCDPSAALFVAPSPKESREEASSDPHADSDTESQTDEEQKPTKRWSDVVSAPPPSKRHASQALNKPILQRLTHDEHYPVRVLDLCCGIGGWQRAAESLGWTVALACDKCSSVGRYHKMNYRSTRFMHVDLMGPTAIERICAAVPQGLEVVVCSPPCQPYSSCGLHRKHDPRADVAIACAEIATRIRPLCFVIENTKLFPTSKSNPVFRDVIRPMLEAAGYTWAIVKSDLCRLPNGIPSSRQRVFCIASLHTLPSDQLQFHRDVKKNRRMPLAEWFPDLIHFRSHPCRSSAGVFDARITPCPASRTSSFTPIDSKRYRPRQNDSAPLCRSRELTRNERLSLAGMPPSHIWPPPGEYCRDPRCCAAQGLPNFELTSVFTGNLVVPVQAECVLRRLGLICDNNDPFTKNGSAMALGALRDKVIPGLAERWHIRLGHPGANKLRDTLNEQPDDVEVPTAAQLAEQDWCRACVTSKATAGKHARKQDKRPPSTFQNQLVHIDICYRKYPDNRNRHMCMLAVDDFSKYIMCERLASQQKQPFQDMLSRLEGRLHAHSRLCWEAINVPQMQNGRPVLRFRSDSAGSVLSRSNIDRMLNKPEGPIDIDQVVPGCHAHAGSVERAHRTIITITRTLMASCSWPIQLWHLAWDHAIFLYNRRSHAALPDRHSPYYMLHKRAPDMSKVRAFGCTAYCFLPHRSRVMKSKLNSPGERRVYVGNPDEGSGWKVYNPKTRKVTLAYSVTFEETLIGIKGHDYKAPPAVVQSIEGNSPPQFGMAPAPTSAPGNPDDTDSEEATDEEKGDLASGSSDENEEILDTWNQIHKTKAGDTMASIAAELDIPIKDLQDKNYSLPGSCPRTGRTPANAELLPGTGLWVPDDRSFHNSSDVALSLAESNEAYRRCYDAVMRQEQLEIEKALQVKVQDPRDIENELFGDFVEHAPDSWEALAGGEKPKGAVPTAHATKPLMCNPDPVDTVLQIMDAASNAVQFVNENHHLSSQELNEHCEAVASVAEGLFEKAFVTAQLTHAGSALVLKGTEGHLARDIVAPKSYEEAMRGRFAKLWQDSIQNELANLKSMNTYRWVHPKPGQRTIGTITAFKVKPDEQGRVKQFKARVCARGYLQVKGRDFYSSFAPVSVITTFRSLVARSAAEGLWCATLDVRSAFLEAPLSAPVLCIPPPGCEPPEPGMVWVLEKCLYGLKQAAHQWHKLLSKTLVKKLGFTQGIVDPCYFHRNADGHTLQLCVHVDDLFLASSSKAYLAAFKERLSQEFTLTSSTTSSSCQYLGMTVTRLSDGAMQISLPGFTKDLLHKHNMQDAKAVSTPMQPGVKLTKEQCPKTDAERLEMSSKPYLQIVGSLLWLVQCVRADIAYATGVLSRFASNPGRQHWQQVKWLLRYLKGTTDFGIVYGRKVDGIPYSPLTAACDSSWGDREERTSTSGYVIYSYGGPISWKSRKMKVIALSSMEAEFHAMCVVTKDIVFLRRLMIKDFGMSPKDFTIPAYGKLALEAYTGDHPPPEPIALMGDNTSAIALAKSTGLSHSRSKHIELKWFWVRAQVQNGIVLPVYCPTKDNIADLLTKPVTKPTMDRLRPRLLWPIEEPPLHAAADDQAQLTYAIAEDSDRDDTLIQAGVLQR